MTAGESVYPIEHVAWAFAEFPRSKHKAVPLQPHCAQARSVNTDTDFEASMHFSRNLVPDFTICASERFSYGAAGDATAAGCGGGRSLSLWRIACRYHLTAIRVVCFVGSVLNIGDWSFEYRSALARIFGLSRQYNKVVPPKGLT
jgi:hypothetical protein